MQRNGIPVHIPQGPGRAAGVLVLSFLLALASLCCSTAWAAPGPPVTGPTEGRPDVQKELGIHVRGIFLSAQGYMLDFRYRATDAGKAARLFDRAVKPYLIHQKTGAKFLVPSASKVGPLRQTTNSPVPGKQYFILFANPGRYVKTGDKVTVVIGDSRIEDLVVE